MTSSRMLFAPAGFLTRIQNETVTMKIGKRHAGAGAALWKQWGRLRRWRKEEVDSGGT